MYNRKNHNVGMVLGTIKMTRSSLFIFAFILLVSVSCNTENCTIEFGTNGDLFREAKNKIYQLDLDLNSVNNGWDLVIDINENDSVVDAKIFEVVEKIEVHRDSTILFQAPNCEKESAFRDVVFVLAYSPKGKEGLKKKRNIGNIEDLEDGWYLIEHINTLAN